MSGETTYVVGITTPGNQYYLPYDEHEWIDEGGYFAPVVAWLAPSEVVDAVMTDLVGLTGSAAEVTIQLGDPTDSANYLTVERVVVVGTAPAGDPQKKFLLLSDVRWYFTRAWMALDANIRRRVGDKVLVGDTLVSQIPVDVIAYAPWSINNGVSYTWTTFKDQILTYLTTARHGRPAISFTTDTFHVVNNAAEVIQEFSTDGLAAVGLARAIECIPGASIRVDNTGTIHVYERTPSAEISFVTSLPKDLLDHGDLVKVDRSRERPVASDHSWRIYFDYELEVRGTYNDSGAGLWGTRSVNDPFLVPVLKVTDQSLTIPAGTYYGFIVRSAPTTVGQGTWITHDEAFAAWGAPTAGGITGALVQLTDDIVARHWFDDSLETNYSRNADGSFNTLWAARILELKRCYRTYFRFNPNFWERVRHAWDVRASIWDPATGTRPFSPAYCNFNLTPVEPNPVSDLPDLSENFSTSYPTSGLLADGFPSGFQVSFEDVELGIVVIDRNVLSKYPGHSDVTVSDVEAPADMDDGTDEIAFQRLKYSSSSEEPIEDAWKFATVVSCAPAAPNDLGRLYEVQVSTDDAVATAGLTGYSLAGYGPDIEDRSQLSEARTAWQDDSGQVTLVLQTLGCDDTTIGITTDDPISFSTSGGVTTGLEPINLAQELIPAAKAIAAVDLLSKLDCYVGVKAIPGSKHVVPIGSLRRVVHKVTKNRFVSVMTCVLPEQHEFRAEDFLRGSARTYILKQIAQGQR